MKNFYLLFLLALITFASCKKNNDENIDNGTVEDSAIYSNLLRLQDKAGENYVLWSKTMDSVEVLKKLQQLFLADPLVKSATIGSQGIAVVYSNGMRGGIFLYPEDLPKGKKKSTAAEDSLYSILDERSITLSQKVILINPSWWERKEYYDWIKQNYLYWLGNVGVTMLDHYHGSSATLDVFTQLSGYRLIHIYSHGLAWPDEKNIEKVYLMTAEIANGTSSVKYFADIKNGNILISQSRVSDLVWKNKYYITENFIAQHNDFSKDTSLFYGGFCYSFLGGWDQLYKKFASAAYFGFTWSVLTDKNASWAVSLVDSMCDISAKTPYNPEKWITGANPVKSYWYEEAQKKVRIEYVGDGTLTFWSQVKIDSLSPARGTIGTVFYIYGKGFGKTQSTSKVTFGTASAGVSSWTDTRITTSVPPGAVTGKVFVTVDGTKSNSVLFTVNGPEISAIVPDSAMVGETVKINGKNFGTNLSVLKIFFGNTQATEITNLSNTSLDVKVPSGAASGNVVVHVGTVTSNAKYFKVISVKPVLNSIKPFSALPGNRIELYGTWPKNDIFPANSYILFDGAIFQPNPSSTRWAEGKLILDIPLASTTGKKQLSVVYKGVESNKADYFIGIPIDSLRLVGDQLKCDYHINIEVQMPDQTTHITSFTGDRGYGAKYFSVQWNGYDFSATYVEGYSTSVFKGIISNDGRTITALSIDYTDTTPGYVGDHIIISLKAGESISLDLFYALNYASSMLQRKIFDAPYYKIEKTELENKFTAVGNRGSGTITKLIGIAPPNGGYDSIIPMQFE